MPRYFFDLFNDIQAPDLEGKDLHDLDAARANAVREAREMMAESVTKGRLDLRHYIQVRDDAGQVVTVVQFGDAVVITDDPKHTRRAELGLPLFPRRQSERNT